MISLLPTKQKAPMKKFVLLLVTCTLLSTSSLAYAAQNEAKAQGNTQPNAGQAQQVMPTGSAVKNQNQVQTQNEGEESQLEVSTQEQEMREYIDVEEESMPVNGLGANSDSKGNSQAAENMSVVAQKVQQLLSVKTTQGGIGDQVRTIAQEHQQTQTQLQTELHKVENRGQLMKSLIGPDYKALKALNQEMEQNQLRIQQLEQIKTQLSNQGDLQMVQEAIEALTAQNTSLQDMVQTEESTSSLLGWLFKMLLK